MKIQDKGIPLQTTQLPKEVDEKLHQVSKLFEQQFLGEMVKAMRNTVGHSDITEPSMAEKIYKDELYGQYTEKWMENGGNGMADIIYRELKEKLIPSQHSRYLPSTTAKKEEK